MDMVVMKFPLKVLDHRTLGQHESPYRLVVRQEGVRATDDVMSHLKRGMAGCIAVVGTPGIDKTMWSNYLLKRCYDEAGWRLCATCDGLAACCWSQVARHACWQLRLACTQH